MRGAAILKKQTQLEEMEESRKIVIHRIQTISHDIQKLKDSHHRQRMLCAGKILDKADLLETFQPDQLYAVLMENRERICGITGDRSL